VSSATLLARPALNTLLSAQPAKAVVEISSTSSVWKSALLEPMLSMEHVNIVPITARAASDQTLPVLLVPVERSSTQELVTINVLT
jgi:hypothetical protein